MNPCPLCGVSDSLKRFPTLRSLSHLYQARRGKVAVLETGVGAKRSAIAIRWALEYFEPRLVVACGYAGALAPTLLIGEVLLASEVVEPGEDDLHWRTAVPAELGDLPVGRLVTVRTIGEPPGCQANVGP